MANALSTPPVPVNEPVKSYAPGSPERHELKAELARQRQGAAEIALRLGTATRTHGERPLTEIQAPHERRLVLGRAESATAQDVSQAIAATTAAQREWSRVPWEHRAAVFLKAADLLSGKHRARMNAATMLGQSKTAYQAEIDAACELADFWRFNVYFMTQIYRDQPLSGPGAWNRVEYRGLEGFVLAIAPFNFTSIALNLPSAPALMGCGVLWKPAHTALLSSVVGLEILEEAGLPPGVITMVAGDAAMIGSIALAHPSLAGVHFTGSTTTFNHIGRTVGENLGRYLSYPRLIGETGGKDFIFAHPSAAADAVTTALVRGAFEYQGQKCSAASRAYIPKSLWTKIGPALKEQTESLSMGSPEDFRHFMAAVIDAKAYGRIMGYVDQAKRDSGVTVVAGGSGDDREGFFIRPTVLKADDPTYRTMQEELFGPVLTVHVYDDRDLEATVAVAERTSPYALTGAIFAQDRRAIVELTAAFAQAAGNFYINDKPTGAVVGQQPFGGARASGTNDKAGSMLNLLRWTSVRTIKETFSPPTSFAYPHMAAP